MVYNIFIIFLFTYVNNIAMRLSYSPLLACPGEVQVACSQPEILRENYNCNFPSKFQAASRLRCKLKNTQQSETSKR